MRIVFEIVKLLFFLSVLFVIVLQLKWGELFDAEYAASLTRMLFPLFFVLGGVAFWWVIAVYFSDSLEPDQQMLMKWFVVGIILWWVGAVLYSVYLAWNI